MGSRSFSYGTYANWVELFQLAKAFDMGLCFFFLMAHTIVHKNLFIVSYYRLRISVLKKLLIISVITDFSNKNRYLMFF